MQAKDVVRAFHFEAIVAESPINDLEIDLVIDDAELFLSFAPALETVDEVLEGDLLVEEVEEGGS